MNPYYPQTIRWYRIRCSWLGLIAFGIWLLSFSAANSETILLNGTESLFAKGGHARETDYARINFDEDTAIRVCTGIAEAEKLYLASEHRGFSRKLFSDEGKHNGLYWKPDDSKGPSPLHLAMASVIADGFSNTTDLTIDSYRGYHFRMLSPQKDRTLENGAASDQRATDSFAVIAYPAEYKVSGVMSFFVNENGLVYKKDLGKNTTRIAGGMEPFQPDSSWTVVRRGRTSLAPSTRWKIGTITAVEPYQKSTSSYSGQSYLVSVRVENTIYMILCTPTYDTGVVLFETGRQLTVLVEGDRLTYNDILGNAIQDSIIARKAVTQ